MEGQCDLGIDDFLENLAEGLLPLEIWVATKSYKPPGYESLPWRVSAPPPLHANRLGLIPFLQGLLLETSEDEEIKARFSSRAEEPLRMAPQDDIASWRQLRGLSSDPQFAVSDSDNLLMDVEGHPISRAGFYRVHLPLFLSAAQSAVAAARPGDLNWQEFADLLLNNKSAFWPRSLGRRSSTFVKQFGRDVLYAVLGMRNPAEEPWRHAVLIELGEHRRVGNLYTPDDAAGALRNFLDVFEEASLPTGGIRLGDAAIARELVPPIGSPPISPRQQQV